MFKGLHTFMEAKGFFFFLMLHKYVPYFQKRPVQKGKLKLSGEYGHVHTL